MPEISEVKKNQEYKFELSRVANWVPLGLMYAAFYMSRYNFTVTNPALCKEFGWTNTQIGWIISMSLAVYGLSVFFNGPLADKIGGKKAILIGCCGALVFNLLFAAGSFFKIFNWEKTPWITLLSYLTVIWAINMYFQSFGALSIVKINAAWFHISERGIFAGLFGAMIQFGRILAVPVGGVILATSSWVWVHIIPPVVLAIIGLITLLKVKDTPEEKGFPRQDEKLVGEDDEKKTSLLFIIKTIFGNPTMWIITGAMMSTGLIRHSIEQWAPKYFIDIQKVSSDSMIFILAFAGQVMIGIFGAFVMGNISDKYFQSRRGPITSIAYFIQAILLLIFALITPGAWLAAILLMVFYFFLNGCHGLIAGTASMDFGGRKAAATAAGMLDGSQYLVGSLTGIGTGWLLDKYGWNAWAWSIIAFSILAGILMATRWYSLPARAKKEEKLIKCPECGGEFKENLPACVHCNRENISKTLEKTILMAKETFNTGIFAILMFLFPLIILLSKVLGGLVKPETKNPNVHSVMLFSFLGILIGILAMKRTKWTKNHSTYEYIKSRYDGIVMLGNLMGITGFVLSLVATIYGVFWLFKSLVG